jgi:hypothetical protein
MDDKKSKIVSASRMRIGVLCLVIWWAPIWALAPVIADVCAIKTSYITFAIVAVQTIIGFLGVWIAGKEVAEIIKTTPKKQVPRKVWHVLVHGSF